MTVSGEAIGAAVADLRSHRVNLTPRARRRSVGDLVGPKWLVAGTPVVDATAIFRSLVDDGKEFDLYGNNVAPPWSQAVIGFHNLYGNVMLLDVYETDTDAVDQWQPADGDDSTAPDKRGTHTIEWGKVQSVLHASLWLGGRVKTGDAFPTTGPFHVWRIPIYPGGEMADVRWHQLEETSEEITNSAIMVLLATFNFLNCRNVTLVEPHRPRAMQRRIARHGFRVSELSVTPMGASVRSDPSGNHITLPLHSVRGHFAEYGKNGKGLLFGKYAGRFWVPQHARGSSEVGVVSQEFTLKPYGGEQTVATPYDCVYHTFGVEGSTDE